MSSAAEFEGPLSRIADKGVSHNGVIHTAGQMIGCRKPRAYTLKTEVLKITLEVLFLTLPKSARRDNTWSVTLTPHEV